MFVYAVMQLTILKVPSEFDYDTAKNYAVDVTSVDSLATKEQIRWRVQGI